MPEPTAPVDWAEMFLACESGIRTIWADDIKEQERQIAIIRGTACINPKVRTIYRERGLI